MFEHPIAWSRRVGEHLTGGYGLNLSAYVKHKYAFGAVGGRVGNTAAAAVGAVFTTAHG